MSDKPRTILMTADMVGGVWIYATDLARHLGRHGIRTVIATMGGEPTPESLKAAGADVIIESAPYKLEWMQDPWDDVARAGDWLLELEARYEPNFIHLNGFVHAGLPWSAPVLVVGHSCVCSWFRSVRKDEAPREWDRYRREVEAGLRAADFVTAPTESMLSSMNEHYGMFRSAGAIYNSRPAGPFVPLPKEDFVLTAGRLWDEAKNARVLDVAAKEIRWPVYAAGSIRHPETGGEVSFEALETIGQLSMDDLARWMGRAAVYALPASYEPFGLTALEAAHAGCALVLGDIPTLREIWGDAAMFVPPHDHEMLAATLDLLMKNRELRMMMSARARRRAAEYPPERMIQAYLDLYEKMLHRFSRQKEDRRAKQALPDRYRRTGGIAQ